MSSSKKYVINVDFPTKSVLHLNPDFFNDNWCRLNEDKKQKDGGKVYLSKDEAIDYLTGKKTLCFNGKIVSNLCVCENCSHKNRQRVHWDLHVQ